MFEDLINRTNIILASIILALYLIFVLSRLLKPKKSRYDQEIEAILASEKHKVKGRFD